MSVYTPDAWVILELVTPEETIYKLLAGWIGGYLGSDSWKLSSGIESMNEFDDRYEFPNYSGSLYVCYKNNEGMTGYTSTIFNGFVRQIEGIEGTSISRIGIEEYKMKEIK